MTSISQNYKISFGILTLVGLILNIRNYTKIMCKLCAIKKGVSLNFHQLPGFQCRGDWI